MSAVFLLSACAADRAGGSTASGNLFGDYLVGRFAGGQDNQAVAARTLLAALASDPNNPVLLQQAFTACLLAGRPEAITLAARLPQEPSAVLLLGDTAAQNHDWKAAQAHYQSLPRNGLSQLLIPLLTAWTQQGMSDTDGALATLQPSLQVNMLAPLATLNAALIADLGNRFPQAAQYYALMQAHAGGITLRMARILANWEYRQGHQQDAQSTLQALGTDSNALAIVVPGLVASMKARPVASPTDGIAELYLAFAAELRQQAGGNDTAATLLRLALNLRPDLTAARMLLADALDASHQPALALRELAVVPGTDPLDPLVRLRRAQLELELDDTQTALAGLRQLAAEQPASPVPVIAIADLQHLGKQNADAITSYGKAIDLTPATSPKAWPLFFSRAVVEQENGNWPAAEGDLQQALHLSPDEPEVLNFLGYSWADQNMHLDEAHEMLTKAASLRPNDGAVIDSLGWVQLRQGQVDQAVKSLERAVQMQPTDSEINGHLGDAYWAAGRKLQARYQWQLALDLKPDAAARPKLLAKLEDAERATGALR